MKGRIATPRKAAAALFIVSLAACLLFISMYPLPGLVSDDIGYMALAENVARGAGFTQDGIHPMVYRPPLFPILLGGWFKATGTSSILSAAVFQSLIHAATAVAALFLFLEVLPSLAWAFGAALFLGINPLLVTRVVFVLQETTILLFTVLAALSTVRLVKDPSMPKAALAGAAWGFCTLAKIVSWYAPLLILAMRFLPARLRFSLRGKEAAVLLFFFGAVLLPWTARNYAHFNRFIPVNDQGEGMLEWNVSQAKVPGEAPGAEYAKEVYARNLPDAERKALLWKYVTDRPYYFFIRRVVRNALHFAAPPRDWWNYRGYFTAGEHRMNFWIPAILFHVPLYIFLLRRTLQWGRGLAPPAFGFLVLLYWTYWIEHALVWGDSRFGLAVYPLLFVMVPPLAGEDSRSPGPDRLSGEREPAHS